jgi:hypothetical protein
MERIDGGKLDWNSGGLIAPAVRVPNAKPVAGHPTWASGVQSIASAPQSGIRSRGSRGAFGNWLAHTVNTSAAMPMTASPLVSLRRRRTALRPRRLRWSRMREGCESSPAAGSIGLWLEVCLVGAGPLLRASTRRVRLAARRAQDHHRLISSTARRASLAARYWRTGSEQPLLGAYGLHS